VTYESGWLQRRISDAAKEYEELPNTFRNALKLETSSRYDAAVKERQQPEEV
jgi:hypothetical protein